MPSSSLIAPDPGLLMTAEGPFAPLSDPHVLCLCQALECYGTVSIVLDGPRLTIMPGRKSPDGTVIWAESSTTAGGGPLAIQEFPISLYTKLLREEPVDGDYHACIAGQAISIRRKDGSASIDCWSTKVCPDADLLTSRIPQDICSPDICLKLGPNPALSRLHQRIGKLGRSADSVLVSANAAGHLLFTASTPYIQSYTIELDAAVQETSDPSDLYKLFGVSVPTTALLKTLRVAGCGVEQLQVVISHRSLLLLIFTTCNARITAIVPHVDS